MKKNITVVLTFDYSKNLYATYKYNLWFKIFGPALNTWITYGCSRENAIKETKMKLFGTIKILEYITLGNDDGIPHTS